MCPILRFGTRWKGRRGDKCSLITLRLYTIVGDCIQFYIVCRYSVVSTYYHKSIPIKLLGILGVRHLPTKWGRGSTHRNTTEAHTEAHKPKHAEAYQGREEEAEQSQKGREGEGQKPEIRTRCATDRAFICAYCII